MRGQCAPMLLCVVLALWGGPAGAQYVSGMGLYAMNLTGQPPSRTTLPGLLGSLAIDGSPTHCANVNVNAVVLPNVFDGLGESFTVEAWIMHPRPADGQYKPFLARHPGMNLGNEEVRGRGRGARAGGPHTRHRQSLHSRSSRRATSTSSRAAATTGSTASTSASKTRSSRRGRTSLCSPARGRMWLPWWTGTAPRTAWSSGSCRCT